MYGRASRLTAKKLFPVGGRVAARAGRRPLSPAQVAQFVWEGHLIMLLGDLGVEVNLG